MMTWLRDLWEEIDNWLSDGIFGPLLFIVLVCILAMCLIHDAPQKPLHLTQPPKPPACDCGKICNRHSHCGLQSCPHGIK